MIKIIKELFNSKNLKRAALCMLFSSPNLTASDYAGINEAIKIIDNEVNEEKQAEVKIKKLSYAM